MNIWRLVFREIRHRRLNFFLGMLSVAIAVASVIAADVLLSGDRAATAEILNQKQETVEKAVAARQEAVNKAGAELQDIMRKTMRELGFNILILPEDQDLSELHLNGTLSKTMPEEYVAKLAATSIVTVNHLLPSVTKRIQWPEKDMEIILFGTRGEVPIMHSSEKKPLLDAVAPGTMVVGHQIHTRLGLKKGDRLTLLGREFTVATLHPERGSSDDVTVWIDLAQAQELLGLQNLIHAILALECECAGDRITQIRSEISRILPGTQIIERYSQALTRAEARGKAKVVAEKALEDEKAAGAITLKEEQEGRRAIEMRHEQFAAVLVPLAILAASLWVALLAFGNARQRTSEIGILRAIGLRAGQIQTAFLTRAACIGLFGAVCGALPGIAVGRMLSTSSIEGGQAAMQTGSFTVLVLVMVLAPLLSIVASWLPAMAVSRMDPALILQSE